MSSSERLSRFLERYWSLLYPDISQLRHLLSDITHEEKVSILKNHNTMYIAAFRGHTEIITAILSSVPQHQRLDLLLVEECTTLHKAAYCGKSGSVETILTHLTAGQQLEILKTRDQDGRIPAERASQGHYNKTERLLREYQQRAEQQLSTDSETNNNNQEYYLTRELHQTKLHLDKQDKDIQTLTSAVTELDTINKNKDEILHKMAEESRELKSTVRNMKEEISKLNSGVAKYQMENGQQLEQILQQQTEFNNQMMQHQEDKSNQMIHYETKLTEKQEQIIQLRDEIRTAGTVRNLAICNLNNRNEVLGTTCTNLRYDVDRIDEIVGNLTETVERIDEQFYPDTDAESSSLIHLVEVQHMMEVLK